MAKLSDIANQNVADDGTLTLDYFTGQFEKKTQYSDFFELKVEEAGDGDIPQNLINPDNEAGDDQTGGGIWSPEGEEPREVNPERFALTGKYIAKFIDSGFNLTATKLIAKGTDKNYSASEKELEDLGDAWSEVAEYKQWEMGPVPRLLLLNGAIYIPKIKQAFDDRRFMELEQRQNMTEEKMRQYENRIKELENERNRATNTAGSTEASGAKA